MAQTGQYRIDDVVVIPAPGTSWENQIIRDGLNAFPINSSYQMHRWKFSELDTDTFEALLDKWLEQQTNGTQLEELETDPAYADTSGEEYGTAVYTDFIIKSIDPRERGLPRYENVNLVFEVYVA